MKRWLAHGELARRMVKENYPDICEDEKLHVLTGENVVAQLEHLRTHPSVAAAHGPRGNATACLGVPHPDRRGPRMGAEQGVYVPLRTMPEHSTLPRGRLITNRRETNG